MVTRRCSRSAFTLVELLVVITIIGILMSLLLPAVQGIRSAARQVQCSNHLKQIGLAIHQHFTTFEVFPTGGGSYGANRTMVDGTPAKFETQQWSWGYQILPYIEQQTLYDHPDDNVVAGTPVPTFFCPSRRPPVALSGGPWQSRSQPRAQTDYAGNAGTSAQGGSQSSGRLGNGDDGIIRYFSLGAVPVAAVRDGMSNTMMIGEKRLNFEYADSECQPGDNDGYVGGYQDDVVRWGSVLPEADFDGPHLNFSNLYPANFQFGGSHSGVFVSVFCDGSVHSMSYSIDGLAFANLCSRDDGQILDLEELE